MSQTRKQEFQELKFLCKGHVTSDVLTGWRAAKDGHSSPPNHFSEDQKQDWFSGYNAYTSYCDIQAKQASKSSAYKDGHASFWRNGGKLINPYTGDLGIEFERGWSQALRSSPIEQYQHTPEPERPVTFKDRYSSPRQTDPLSAPKRDYKSVKDGE